MPSPSVAPAIATPATDAEIGTDVVAMEEEEEGDEDTVMEERDAQPVKLANAEVDNPAL